MVKTQQHGDPPSFRNLWSSAPEEQIDPEGLNCAHPAQAWDSVLWGRRTWDTSECFSLEKWTEYHFLQHRLSWLFHRAIHFTSNQLLLS